MEPGVFHDLANKRSRCRLTVRPCDSDDVALQESESQFQLPEHRQPLFTCQRKLWHIERHSRPHHDHVLVEECAGVPLDMPQLALARKKGLPVLGELELAYRFLK